MATRSGDPFNPEEIEVPLVLPKGKKLLSYDMGGSLLKLAYTTESTKDKTKIRMLTFNNLDLDAAIAFVKKEVFRGVQADHVTVIASGIGSRTYKDKIEKGFGIKEQQMTDEFVCFGGGLEFMLKHLEESQYLHPYTDMPVPTREQMGMPHDICGVSKELEMEMREYDSKFPAILVTGGSGMAFYLVRDNEKPMMLGVSPVAGMVFYALGSHLTGAKSYEELIEIASRGKASVLTTTIGDVSTADISDSNYADVDMNNFSKTVSESGRSAMDMEIFPFGNIIRKGVKEPSKEDLARSLLHMIGQQTMHWLDHLAVCNKVNKVYFSGTFFANNDVMREYFTALPLLSNMFGWPIRPRFMKYEGYIGVLGAIFGNLNENTTTQL